MATEAKETENPFRRRDSISRTPPKQRQLSNVKGRHRSGSCPDTDRNIIDWNVTKRKMEEGPGDVTTAEEFQGIHDLIKRIREDTDALKKEIENTYKPKKEFKTLTSSIALWAKKLESSIQTEAGKGLKEWLEHRVDRTREQEMKDLRTENQNLHKQIQDMVAKHKDVLEKDWRDKIFLTTTQQGAPTERETSEVVLQTDGKINVRMQTDHTSTREAAVQTEPIEEVNKWRQAGRIRKHIEEGPIEYKTFKEIKDLDWPEMLYKKVKEVIGNPLKEASENDMVVVINKQEETEKKIMTQIRDRFPVIKEINMEDKRLGEVVQITNVTKLSTDGEDTINIEKTIYLIITDATLEKEETDKATFTALKKLNRQWKEKKKREISFLEITEEKKSTTREILEYIIRDNEISTIMYKPRAAARKTNSEL